VAGILSPELRYEIRRAHTRREVALDLYSERSHWPRQTAVRQARVDSYHQDRITASDVSEFLGIRLQHLEKIEAEVMNGATGPFAAN
jgi:hypothetical protein